ncbi:MAG: hypothetical protein ACTSYB_09845 [Candidatus Helarchaeota archaeon]
MNYSNFEISLFIILPFIAALVTYLLIPPFKRKILQLQITGIDKHKLNNPVIPEMGGAVVLVGFFCAIIPFLVISLFLYPESTYTSVIGLIALLIFFTGLVGIWDDIRRRKPNQNGRAQVVKTICTVLISIPLAFLTYHFYRSYGFFGEVYFILTIWIGSLYSIILVPAIFTGVANAVNMLGGFNGLEAGVSIIICLSMGSFFIYNGLVGLPLILFAYGAALIAFFRYNRYPSSIFPGDTMTYSFGALLACCIIMGNVIQESLLFGAFSCGLWIVEFWMKFRVKFKGQSFAKVNPDQSLEVPDTGYASLTHVAIALIKKIKGKCYEKDVTLTFIIVQILLSILAWSLSIFL